MAKPTATPAKKGPVPVPRWEDADAYAIQALERGSASPDQQKRALRWIVEGACSTYDFCDRPDNERLAAIFEGRRFAGLQIVKLIKINMSMFKRQQRTEEKENG